MQVLFSEIYSGNIAKMVFLQYLESFRLRKCVAAWKREERKFYFCRTKQPKKFLKAKRKKYNKH